MTEVDTRSVIRRLKDHLGLRTNKQLAEWFDRPPYTVGTWVQRNTCDWALLLSKIRGMPVNDIVYIIYGELVPAAPEGDVVIQRLEAQVEALQKTITAIVAESRSEVVSLKRHQPKNTV